MAQKSAELWERQPNKTPYCGMNCDCAEVSIDEKALTAALNNADETLAWLTGFPLEEIDNIMRQHHAVDS